jgi:hypothetical protein
MRDVHAVDATKLFNKELPMATWDKTVDCPA